MVIAIYYLNKNGKMEGFKGESNGYIIGRPARIDIPVDPYGVYIMDKEGHPIVDTGIRDPTISRNHLLVDQVWEKVRVRDWGPYGTGSTNGTIVTIYYMRPSYLERTVDRLTKEAKDEVKLLFKILKGDYIDIEKGYCAVLQLGSAKYITVCNE